MRIFLTCLLTAGLLACGDSASESDSGASSQASRNGGDAAEFSVTDSMGGGFDSNSPRARVDWAYASKVRLSARGGGVSVDGRDMPDTGAAETTELGFNNTSYSMTVEIEGETRAVSCKPGDPAEGRFERTGIADGRISGNFEVVFERCFDGMTGGAIEVPGLPVSASGSFEDLPLTR